MLDSTFQNLIYREINRCKVPNLFKQLLLDVYVTVYLRCSKVYGPHLYSVSTFIVQSLKMSIIILSVWKWNKSCELPFACIFIHIHPSSIHIKPIASDMAFFWSDWTVSYSLQYTMNRAIITTWASWTEYATLF